ncbi:MAG TPA: VWA domain-containing protein [Vicinamibacteria bacterium]
MSDAALRLARLGEALRGHGVAATLRDELDAAEALGHVDRADRAEVRAALRIAMRIPRSAFATFDRLFGVFWEGAPPPPPAMAPPPRPAARPNARGVLRWDPDRRRLGDDGGDPSPDGAHPGYSPDAVLRHKPFEEAWTEGELAAMERLLARLARRLATRRSRRLVPTRGRGRPDLRGSYRRALRTSGEVLAFARRARAVERPRLVFLLDTSGSMDGCSRFLLTFVLCLRRAAPGAEAFAFNTELVPLTRVLAPGKVRLTLDRLAASVPDWSGGTRIGACLADFVREHLAAVDPRTVVVVLSDGLDRGDPALLGDALRTIARRARRLIWLNPLMGDARWEPAAAGMEAALPHIDHLASAHDLSSLERLLPQIAS